MKFYILALVVYILLRILKENRLFFFYFILGSISFFLMMLYFVGDELEQILKIILSDSLFYIMHYFKSVEIFKEYYLINITLKNGSMMSWIIDYECTGIVELLVFYSLLMFYPIKDIFYKIRYFLIGSIYLMLANIIRILVITFAVVEFGDKVFYFSHVIIARIVFFILVIILYYNVFTRKHVNQQIVGDLYVNK